MKHTSNPASRANAAKPPQPALSLNSILNTYNTYSYDPNRSRLSVLGKSAVKLKHSRNRQLFYTKPFVSNIYKDFDKNQWAKLIKNTVKSSRYLWPADIVEMSPNKYALVLPLRNDLGGYESIECMLSNRTYAQQDWDYQASVMLAKNLLNAWCKFDDCKYLYHEFSFENMFCNMENRVMFDFSFSTHNYNNLKNGARVMPNKISPDYTDPYYYNRKSLDNDVISNYFSMSIILFRLLVGVLPYQGRLLEGVHNITKHDHDDWIRWYHQNPIFIFDKNENVNRISSTANPERCEVRWERLPPLIKGMFHTVFTHDNAMRVKKPVFFTPQDWRSVIC